MVDPSVDDYSRADLKPERTDAEPAGPLTRRARKAQRQRQFLDAYLASGLTGRAAAEAGVTRQATRKWQQDPMFRAAMARARQDHLERLTATRTDNIRAGMQRFEQHIRTLDGSALGAAAARRPAETSRPRPSAPSATRASRPETREAGRRESPLQQAHRQLRFLKKYAEYGIVRAACETLHIERATVRHWRKTDDVFEALFLEAQEEHCELIYDALVQRGLIGTLTPVFYRGKQIGQVRKYDQKALAQLVRLQFPEAFARVRPAPPAEPAPVHVTPKQVLVPLDQLTDEELALLEKIQGKAIHP